MRKCVMALVFVPSLLLVALRADSIKHVNKNHHATQSILSQKKSDSFAWLRQSGTFSANLKIFHMVRTFDNVVPDTKAFTGGGIVKYESKKFYGLQFGFAYYGSHRIGGFYSRQEGIGTSLLQSSGEDIGFLGEAYIEYKTAKTRFKAGRQRLATPLMGDLYLRVLPTVYEAVIMKNEDVPDTSFEIGYVKSYSHFGSKYSGFDNNQGVWGKDGLVYIYIENSSMKHFFIRGEYIRAVSDTDNRGAAVSIQDYRYADIRYDLFENRNLYLKVQYGGNRYHHAPDSTLVGAKIGTTVFKRFETTLFYDKILDNHFEVIMASPMFSDWQQGYGLYEPSSAIGGSVLIKPAKDLSVRLVYVDVSSDTQKLVDDFSEFNFDLKYKINYWSKLRISYSVKNQTDASERLLHAGEGGREDRNDLRIIYTMNF